MPENPDRIAQADDPKIPERAKRGNAERPERVPTKGHEGGVPASEQQSKAYNARKDHADALADAAGGDRDPSDHSAAQRGLSG